MVSYRLSQLSDDAQRLAIAFDDKDSPLKVVTREAASSLRWFTQVPSIIRGQGWLSPRHLY